MGVGCLGGNAVVPAVKGLGLIGNPPDVEETTLRRTIVADRRSESHIRASADTLSQGVDLSDLKVDTASGTTIASGFSYIEPGIRRAAVANDCIDPQFAPRRCILWNSDLDAEVAVGIWMSHG